MNQHLKKKKKSKKLWITLFIVAVVAFMLGYWYSVGFLGA